MTHPLALTNLLKLRSYFRKAQGMAPERRARLRLRLLRQVARHAYLHTAHYRRAWEAAGLRFEDLIALDGPGLLPVVEKSAVVAEPEAFKADNYDALCAFHTSTSATAFEFDARALAVSKVKTAAAYFDLFKRSGLSSGIRILNMVAGLDALPNLVEPGPVIEQIKVLPYTAEPESWFAEIDEFQPHAIFAYPSFLSAYARHTQRGAPPPVKLVVACGELMDEAQSALWRDAWGAEVVCRYAATESLCPIATACWFGRLHIDADLFWVESVPIEGQPRIVLTSLFNYRMPLLRYDTDDIGEAAERNCECGQRTPILTIHGKRSESLRLANGRWISAADMQSRLNGVRGLEDWQVVRRGGDRLRLDAVAPGREAVGLSEEVNRLFAALAGEPLDVEVRTVERLPRALDGKRRRLIEAHDASAVPVGSEGFIERILGQGGSL